MPDAAAPVVVFVGGGPRVTSLLERLSANASAAGSGPMEVHVVDPHPSGAGRIWRQRQSRLLWMNSVAGDVTLFTDESVTIDGPHRPGPTLAEWIAGAGRTLLAAHGIDPSTTALGGNDFVPREVAGHYLAWAFDRAAAALPPGSRVYRHTDSAVAVTDDVEGRQRIRLAGGASLAADLVVLAQGYLDRTPEPAEQVLADHAVRVGARYVPPGYTADLDLSGLGAGQPVLVRGFGLAFIDLMVLLTQGRGGRFDTRSDGTLAYRRSGAEPRLIVGSRRGVPYHAKLGYQLPATGPSLPEYLPSPGSFAPDRYDYRRDIAPLVAAELRAAHYRRLFDAHPERCSGRWSELRAALDAGAAGSADQLRRQVPDPRDRFDLDRLNRPLAGRRWAGAGVEQAVRQHIRADLARRADPRFSPDRAVFDRLLTVHGTLAAMAAAGALTADDRVRHVEGEFHSLFSFLASGPPPRRLSELLALNEAGVVRFAGPDLQITPVDAGFRADSPAGPTSWTAATLVDARLPRTEASAVTDPLLRGLLADGELAHGNGKLLADVRARAVRADGTAHPRRYLLGPSVAGSAGSAGFARPGFNAPSLRQNDAVARDLLSQLREITDRRARPRAVALAGSR